MNLLPASSFWLFGSNVAFSMWYHCQKRWEFPFRWPHHPLLARLELQWKSTKVFVIHAEHRSGLTLSYRRIKKSLLPVWCATWKEKCQRTRLALCFTCCRPSSIMKRVLSSLLPSPFAPPSDGCDRMNQMLTSRILQPHWSPCGQMQSLETRFGKPVGSKEYHLERSGRTEWITKGNDGSGDLCMRPARLVAWPKDPLRQKQCSVLEKESRGGCLPSPRDWLTGSNKHLFTSFGEWWTVLQWAHESRRR